MLPSKVALSVILPAYEEAANLELLLPRLQSSLSLLGITYEILVVDTLEPRDHTAEVCARHGVTCIKRTPTNAFGDAYRSGIAVSRGRHVLFMDADGSHSPTVIPDLYAHVFSHDIVIASRYVRGGATENSFMLELMSRVLNLTYAIVLGIRCRDMSNSFKIYHGDRLRDLDLRCDNFDIVEEIMVGFARDGRSLSIKEIPFTFQRRDKGRSKRNLLAFIVSYFFTLLRLRFRSFKKPAQTSSVQDHRKAA